jgi:hypothetical protein
MPTPNARPIPFRATTLSDAVDATNGPPGAMQILQNLIPAPFNRQIMVPRPAAIQSTNFSSFTSPVGVELQYIVGNIVYGFVQSGRFAGKSEPYAYNTVSRSFLTLQGVTAAKCPTSTSNTGDWTPPTADQVGSRVMMTHPGFTGANNIVMAWFDLTGFSTSGITGNTHATNIIDGLSSNPLTDGVSPGMLISDNVGDIPAGAYVVEVTATTIEISAPTTGANSGVVLTITGGTAASPLYAAGNTNGRLLGSIPNAVVNFNGRAYYATGPKTDFSDAGNAVQISDNPSVQTINFQNGVKITALNGTPFTNVLGGITQTLVVFQGTSFIQQISGDPTTSNLLAQLLFSGTGTLAPNTIDNAPQGLFFMAPDGLRIISTQGIVSSALGTQGDGVSMPFINAQFPTRMAGAWNNDTYRIAVKTATTPASIWGQFNWGQALWGAGEIVTQEYWFNTKLNVWTGPHTFPSTLITANPVGGDFIISSLSAGPGLWQSDTIGTAADSYTELGQILTCSALTCLMPDNEVMAMNSMGAQSTAIGFASSAGMTANVFLVRENGQQLDTVQIPVSGQTEAIWGQFNWGSANWGAAASKYAQYQISWNQPLVFKQGMIGVSFPAGPGNLMGNFYLRIEPLGYLLLGESDAA